MLATVLVVGSAPAAQPWFEEVPAARSGIHWTHDNGMSPTRYLPESLGPGVAFLDFDNDGWMDVFLVNSGPSDFYRPTAKAHHALYRNNQGRGFIDVTARAGVAAGSSFAMGAAVGDFDNDGYPDLFVTSYGPSTLYHNNKDGTFTDATRQAGVATNRWTTSAAWFDYDGDGLLDLFACGFVDYRRETQEACIKARGGKPGYCIPRMFRPGPSFLFRNVGGGRFVDVTAEAGITRRPGKSLGVVATDIDGDGRMDLFVANDTVENFLFMNRGGKRFEDTGIAALVGLGHDGAARSGMGVDAADVDGDGRQDLFVSNIDREMFALYRNTAYGVFDDLSFGGEIGRSTYNLSGWGAKLFDYDNDGVIDLLVVNGHPDDKVSERTAKVKYREPMLLFRQSNGFRNVSALAGPVFTRDLSARGLAVGDYDNDGRLDALVGVNGDEPLLLRNGSGEGNSWVGLKLRGVKANRDGVGAKISWRAGGAVRTRLKTGGGSYLSAHDPREVLGLGPASKVDWVEVRWPAPSLHTERFVALRAGQYSVVVEGEGTAVR